MWLGSHCSFMSGRACLVMAVPMNNELFLSVEVWLITFVRDVLPCLHISLSC